MTSVGCVLEGAAPLNDQAQAKAEMARLGGVAEQNALDLAKQVARAFADRQLCAGEIKKLPIIFLAGIAGSRLHDSNSGQLWPLGVSDRALLALNPDGDTPALSSASIVPNGIFYDEALQNMLADAGWYANTLWPRRYQFAYDWRLDNTSQVQALARMVSEVLFDSGAKKVILIAHSMGGLIARAYINTSGADKVDTLITINTPFYGAPKAYYAAINGYTFGNWTVNQGMMKAICQSWPAGYQLMPRVPFVLDGRTNTFYPLSVSDGIRYKWFGGVTPYAFRDVYTPSKDNILGLNQALIERAKQFYRLLYQDDGWARPLPAGVRHYVIAGYGVSTLSSYRAADVLPGEPGVEMDGRTHCGSSPLLGTAMAPSRSGASILGRSPASTGSPTRARPLRPATWS
jgi:pimeloyl-ACP methyl ester carboxylesterase